MSSLPVWAQNQERTFSRWVNSHLSSRKLRLDKIEDLKRGDILCALLEEISQKKLTGVKSNPMGIHQEFSNCHIAMEFIKQQRLKLVNIGAEDIHAGNVRLLLGLVWTIILRYQIAPKDNGDGGAAKNALLDWIRAKIPEYDIKNFTTDWTSGRAICALVNSMKPGLIPHHWTLTGEALGNCTLGVNTADIKLRIAPLVIGEEMASADLDEHSMMCYLSQFRDCYVPINWAKQASAQGSGLESGVMARACPFTITVPADCDGELAVEVEGVDRMSSCHLINNGEGCYSASYVPKESGVFTVKITIDGIHIPHSPYRVPISTGGLRLFFSASKTTGMEALCSVERGLPFGQFGEFSSWRPVDTMLPDNIDATMSNSSGRVRALLLVLDGDHSMAQLAQDGTLSHLLTTANAAPLSTSLPWDPAPWSRPCAPPTPAAFRESTKENIPDNIPVSPRSPKRRADSSLSRPGRAAPMRPSLDTLQKPLTSVSCTTHMPVVSLATSVLQEFTC